MKNSPMTWLFVLLCCILLAGCDAKEKIDPKIPEKDVLPAQLAEQPPKAYDTGKFGELHLPSNCEPMSAGQGHHGDLVVMVKNSSGTVFLFKFDQPVYPVRVLKDMNPLW